MSQFWDWMDRIFPPPPDESVLLPQPPDEAPRGQLMEYAGVCAMVIAHRGFKFAPRWMPTMRGTVHDRVIRAYMERWYPDTPLPHP